MSDMIQLVMAAAILAFFAYAIFRSGRSNPVGTGQLQNQLNTIGASVKQLTDKIDGCALTSEVDQLKAELLAMETRSASSGEVIALEGKINVMDQKLTGSIETLDTKIEGWGGATRRVESMVQRIEGILVKKALGGD